MNSPTIQGEGALAGTVSHFIRFGGCDYACAWCDSAPAVLPELVRRAERLTLQEVVTRVRMLPPAQWVTISGGNPALFDLELLVEALQYCGFKVAVETQGSLWKPWLATVDQLTISVKPPSSGMKGEMHPALEEYLLDWHAYYSSKVNLKVPIHDFDDFVFAQQLHAKWDTVAVGYSGVPFYLSVVTEMGGLQGDFAGGAIDSKEDILNRYKQVIDWTLAAPDMKDVRVIPQLHVLVWHHDRGH